MQKLHHPHLCVVMVIDVFSKVFLGKEILNYCEYQILKYINISHNSLLVSVLEEGQIRHFPKGASFKSYISHWISLFIFWF